eukprot:5583175-Pyramimonas_sp.AAC.1
MLSVSSPPDFKGGSLGDVIEDREYSLRALAFGSRHARPSCPDTAGVRYVMGRSLHRSYLISSIHSPY